MIRKILIRLILAAMASCSVGMATHVTTYDADGDYGVYLGPLGVEHAHDSYGIDVWSCSETVWIGSFRCPAWEPPTIRTRHAVYRVPEWTPLPMTMILELSINWDRNRDWTRCQVHYAATTQVRCPDSYRLEW